MTLKKITKWSDVYILRNHIVDTYQLERSEILTYPNNIDMIANSGLLLLLCDIKYKSCLCAFGVDDNYIQDQEYGILAWQRQ